MIRCIVALLLLLCPANVVQAEERTFSRFSVDLPEGWDGEETTNFLNGNKEGYMLVLGKKDDEGENFLAQVSVFLLPALPGTAEAIARQMASMQDNASTPQKDENFWTFSGEPRTETFKAMAVTKVAATTENVLVIISQDPHGLGADALVASLRGITPEAKEALSGNWQQKD
jgi:hypothetical protein